MPGTVLSLVPHTLEVRHPIESNYLLDTSGGPSAPFQGCREVRRLLDSLEAFGIFDLPPLGQWTRSIGLSGRFCASRQVSKAGTVGTQGRGRIIESSGDRRLSGVDGAHRRIRTGLNQGVTQKR